ncbi:XIAP-associated factor 1 isoform X1 [Callorhinchus milii]|uniref:Uncharacterized protein n=1 Tax=Callorhinchus milii TaxID=7868 RepID=A0A4W3IUA4_CALMI|nr:XIAP-associated factor 1 isoform X1 [Callorhinchus milii]XP_007894700.1 XIAP-associated factor 1 isoform X1 [Callorhinchus milii]|eukprot:gi/632957832/ref/XP_007894699.1/ PREDICTED: XIAP-associated factor 1 isoform X1 [Callorhinchus milii]
MEESEEERVCGNCHRSVKKSTYTIHDAHCTRFIELCPQCKEPVPRVEMKEHREEQHSQVHCPLCHSMMEKCKLEIHQSEQCEERQVSCQYCELEQPHRVLRKHEEVCGSRTERCQDCNSYIMYKKLQTHKDTCGQRPSLAQGDNSEIRNESWTRSIPEDLLLQDQRNAGLYPSLFSSQSQEANSSGSPHSPPSPLAASSSAWPSAELFFSSALSFSNKTARVGGDDMCEIDSCSVCHCALPIEILHKHEVKCQLFAALRNKRTIHEGLKEDKFRAANPALDPTEARADEPAHGTF